MTDIEPKHLFRVPTELQQTNTPLNRVLVIGSCLIGGLPATIKHTHPKCEVDYIAFNNLAQLPAHPPAPIEAYDFQVLQIALRSILPDSTYFRVQYHDDIALQTMFERAKETLAISLSAGLKYAKEAGVLTFVSNFLLPQTNPFGRLFSKYDLRNPVCFIHKLNEFLDTEIRAIPNCYALDVDQVAATFGKRWIQDDPVWQINHASALSNWDLENDQARLEPVTPASDRYDLKIWQFAQATWAETVAMYRTIKQIDTVKLVITDLDDTLWRGVLAEEGVKSVEGWPLGYAEALLFLKRRGVVLAIASKNNPQFIKENFDRVYGAKRLTLEDFAIHKINWLPKVENVAEILKEVNVLANSVVFIDDNPAERSAVQKAFPAIRVLGGDLYATRRILLWAPETQVAAITHESSRRTEMITAQVTREAARETMSREAFLTSLNITITKQRIDTVDHSSFQRVMELVNKSNQFNTTGRRWTHAEWTTAFNNGIKVLAFEVVDDFTSYGLVAIGIISDNSIIQFVMSCRVIGLGVEETAIAEINRFLLESGYNEMYGRFEKSAANDVCKDLFEKTGFIFAAELWRKATVPCLTSPAHVKVK